MNRGQYSFDSVLPLPDILAKVVDKTEHLNQKGNLI